MDQPFMETIIQFTDNAANKKDGTIYRPKYRN